MCKCVCLYRSEKRKSRKKAWDAYIKKKKGTDVSETLPDVIVIYPVARAPALYESSLQYVSVESHTDKMHPDI